MSKKGEETMGRIVQSFRELEVYQASFKLQQEIF